jgi:hypothetical protein
MTRFEKDLNTFMAVAHEVALAAAFDSPTTPEVRRHAQALSTFAKDRLAEIRRAERAKRPAMQISGEVRPSIVALARDAVFARLKEIWTIYPEMQLAHRDCVGMSDDDLRSALEDAESMIERHTV